MKVFPLRVGATTVPFSKSYRGIIVVLALLGFFLAPSSSRADSVPADARQVSGIPGKRALVLGGGAVTGQSWEIGLLKGLHDQGIDLSQADLIVATSSGSILGAQLSAGRTIDALYTAQFAPPI